jgi:LmbE family N-acetylglucosaminyl deacetylase
MLFDDQLDSHSRGGERKGQVKVFLLAHQDDEIFFLPHIINFEPKLFLYLTDGVSAGSAISTLDTRTSEAESVFKKYLEPLNSRVIWWGQKNSISEGELHRYVNQGLIDELRKLLISQGCEVTTFITTAFEGAHQDHDSVAVIARELDKIFKVGTIEMSTYPQRFSRFYSFKVLKPGTPEKTFQFNRIKVFFLAIRMMASYRTQLLTWAGLGLATLSVYAFRGYRSTSPRSVDLIELCFYESRRRASQNEVLKSLTFFK